MQAVLLPARHAAGALPASAPRPAAQLPRRSTCRHAATLEAPPAPDLAQQLRTARAQAVELFDEIGASGIFAPGRSELDCNTEIFQLAAQKFNTRKHWHQRIVRAGTNTRVPYGTNPPNLVLQQDDIAFVDLGPVFGGIEADFARSYVMGDDAEKHKLNAALPRVFNACKEHYQAHPEQTGEEFHSFVCRQCESEGYSYGNWFCAHLLGKFDHERDYPKGDDNYAAPGNTTSMAAPASNGLPRFWVLEVHLLHPNGQWAGFYEDLLNIDF